MANYKLEFYIKREKKGSRPRFFVRGDYPPHGNMTLRQLWEMIRRSIGNNDEELRELKEIKIVAKFDEDLA